MLAESLGRPGSFRVPGSTDDSDSWPAASGPPIERATCNLSHEKMMARLHSDVAGLVSPEAHDNSTLLS
jgi:hypothetical protein